jgi:hypothetical protein
VPADVRRAFVKRKIVVLGVVSPKGSDDKLVRKSLNKVDKLHGRVFVKTVPVKRISRYGSITRGTDLSQTPSVVIVDFGFKATTLAGWVDAPTIDQAVVDAIRASGTLYPDAYLREVAQACSHLFPDVNILFEPTSASDVDKLIGKTGVQLGQFKTELASLSTPKKWRPFSKATRADTQTMASTFAAAQAFLGAHPTAARWAAADKRFTPTLTRAGNRLDKRFAAQDVISCEQG